MKYSTSALLGALAFLGATSASPCQSNSCKAFPGTEDWPSSRSWHRLNDTLGGHLIKPVAPAGVCHKGQPNYDKEECPTLKEDWLSYDWHSDNPVSVMWNNWANYTCLPDPKAPCSAGGYPSYVVNATTAKHVKAGVDFAREHNVRLIVKSSGHDFLGRSNAPGALSIWVHHLNDITYHKGEYKLTGSDTVIKGDAVSCGGGSEMYDLYKETAKHNTTIVGGMAKSVSVGGYITGGGHSQLGPDYGLAADQVLEIEVVTPDGRILTVNEDKHAALFWAIRGGGGSTFGVITSFTMKTHPTPKVQSFFLVAGIDTDSPYAEDLVTFMAGQTPKLMDEGLRGYGFLALNGSIPGMGGQWAGFAGAMTLMDKGHDAVSEIVKPLNKTLIEKFKGAARLSILGYQSYDTWLDYFDVNFDNGTAGGSAILKSRLIDADALTKDPKALKKALVSAIGPDGNIGFYLLGGKGVQDVKPRGDSDAVNPGWRRAIIHALGTAELKPFDEAGQTKAEKDLNERWEHLEKLTPGMGAYLNEAAGFEKDPAETFWGDNYERLLRIKRSIDPHDVLWCTPCVGNNRWKEKEGGRLCRRSSGGVEVDL